MEDLDVKEVISYLNEQKEEKKNLFSRRSQGPPRFQLDGDNITVAP